MIPVNGANSHDVRALFLENMYYDLWVQNKFVAIKSLIAIFKATVLIQSPVIFVKIFLQLLTEDHLARCLSAYRRFL